MQRSLSFIRGVYEGSPDATPAIQRGGGSLGKGAGGDRSKIDVSQCLPSRHLHMAHRGLGLRQGKYIHASWMETALQVPRSEELPMQRAAGAASLMCTHPDQVQGFPVLVAGWDWGLAIARAILLGTRGDIEGANCNFHLLRDLLINSAGKYPLSNYDKYLEGIVSF